MKTLTRWLVSIGLIVLGASCSWSRFDDLGTDTPVVSLENPSNVIVAGSKVAAARGKAGVTLLVSGETNLAIYALGRSDNPGTEASRNIPCSRNSSCWMGSHITPYFLASDDKASTPCFAAALQRSQRGSLDVRVECDNGKARILTIPPSWSENGASRLSANTAANIQMASSPMDEPRTLLVALPEQGWAWWYPPDMERPFHLEPPETKVKMLGSSVAVVTGEEVSWLVLGEPENQRLWLYEGLADGTVSLETCLEGGADFARTLGTGDFDSDGLEDLAIASQSKVEILLHTAIADLVGDSGEECLSVGDFSSGEAKCKNDDTVKDCAHAEFGTALARADLDHDGKDELLVRMPGAKVEGAPRAGAVAVFALDDEGLSQKDTLTIGSPAKDDRLGASITGIRLDDLDAVVAGAPGKSAALIFYCSELVPPNKSGPRCR